MRRRLSFIFAGIFFAGLASTGAYWLSQFFSGDLVEEAVVFEKPGGERDSDFSRDPANYRSLDAELKTDSNPHAVVLITRYAPGGSGRSKYDLVVENATTNEEIVSKRFSVNISSQTARASQAESRTLTADQSSKISRIAVFSVPAATTYRVKIVPTERQSSRVLSLTIQLRSGVVSLSIAFFLVGAPCMMFGLFGLIVLLITLPRRSTVNINQDS